MYQQRGTEEENMGLVNKSRSHKFRHIKHPCIMLRRAHSGHLLDLDE